MDLSGVFDGDVRLLSDKPRRTAAGRYILSRLHKCFSDEQKSLKASWRGQTERQCSDLPQKCPEQKESTVFFWSARKEQTHQIRGASLGQIDKWPQIYWEWSTYYNCLELTLREELTCLMINHLMMDLCCLNIHNLYKCASKYWLMQLYYFCRIHVACWCDVLWRYSYSLNCRIRVTQTMSHIGSVKLNSMTGTTEGKWKTSSCEICFFNTLQPYEPVFFVPWKSLSRENYLM